MSGVIALDPRDRSQEFFSTVAVLKKQMQQTSVTNGLSTSLTHSRSQGGSSQNGNGSLSLESKATSPTLFAQQTQFTQAAKHISVGIISLTEKLEHLGKLAKQKSLFKDPVQEINKLTFVIKRDLNTLSNEIDLLEAFVRQQRGENVEADNKQHSTELVKSLQRELAGATSHFADILKVRQQNLKEGSKRRKEFEGGSGHKHKHRSVASLSSNLSLEDESQSALLEAEHKDGGVVERKEAGQQLSVLVEPVQEDSYYKDRAEALESITKTISELAEMYKRLSMLVQMQHEQTERIDANVDTALLNLDSGFQQLVKANDQEKGNTWLILKVLAMLIAFTVLWVIIR